MVLAQGMNDAAFTDNLDEALLANACFITPGTPEPSSVDRLERDMQARWGDQRGWAGACVRI